jgi:hypothetical protein
MSRKHILGIVDNLSEDELEKVYHLLREAEEEDEES